MVDISLKINDVMSDPDVMEEIIDGLLEDIYQDKKKLSTFLDRMTDWYEDEIIEIISDKIVEGKA